MDSVVVRMLAWGIDDLLPSVPMMQLLSMMRLMKMLIMKLRTQVLVACGMVGAVSIATISSSAWLSPCGLVRTWLSSLVTMKMTRESKLRLKTFDRALAQWVAGREASGVCVTQALIRHKGSQLLAPYGEQALALGGGWMNCFKRRHKLSSFNIHGESNDVDDEAAEQALSDLLIATARFKLRDIYNMDKSSVYYSMLPTKTIARKTIKGRKKAKERIAVLPAVNADRSDKREIFFIGTAAKPHVFQKRSPTTEGYAYANTKKTYMTRPVFEKWLLKFNAEMHEQKRHVLWC